VGPHPGKHQAGRLLGFGTDFSTELQVRVLVFLMILGLTGGTYPVVGFGCKGKNWSRIEIIGPDSIPPTR